VSVVPGKAAELARTHRVSAPWAGVRLSTFDRTGFCQLIRASIEERAGLLVTFLNPFYARATAADAELAGTVDQFDVVQPDGWGVVYGARLAGIPVPERAAIEDVERPVFGWLAARGGRVFLFGSAPGVAEAAAEVLTSSFPGIHVVGTRHGWLDVEAGHPGHIDEADARQVADEIRAGSCDLVLVGLPTPLQQQWAATYGRTLDCPLVMTAGAYLDKLAEGLDWYPRWMEKARLGWAYRVYREPRRLAGRYTVGTARFLVLVVAAAVKARRRR
jgi:N-acetylglucosaminyldiphosphoundecaprenol N-acetyl-beta-D-mannosaminyltransferase